ncbi:unnamed protein product, partial [Mesorhabditis belari]|uniref:Transmembrane protein 186 n=1 Tax=Mesorhabditis belari TaxID=2138241 RepID=A0AAF3EJW5_9BILA
MFTASPTSSCVQDRGGVIYRDLLAAREKYTINSPLAAREIIRRLFCDPNVDLCSVLPPEYPSPDHPYTLIYDLINANSSFFETILESDEMLGDELWNAVKEHLDKATQTLINSVIMVCAGEWIKRLLPIEASTEQFRNDSCRPQLVAYRICTPLNLFLPDSPILNKLSTDISTQVQEADVTLRPKFISFISRFIITLCSTTQFPSVNRLVLLRHLCKQFHIFCLNSHANPEVASVKLRVHVRPMFASALYQFLQETLNECQSVIIFKDIVDIWLTWVRPWRYVAPIGDEMSIGPFTQFVQNHEKYYTVLLGKIFRRIRELGSGSESVRMLKSVFECSWKPPMVDALRMLGVDPCAKTIETINAVRSLRETKRAYIDEVTERALNNSWWKKMVGSEEDNELFKLRDEVMQLDDAVKEAVEHLHLPPIGYLNTPPSTLQTSTSSHRLLHTTPRSRVSKIPDHQRDPHTGIMTLTPEGRRQVISRECSFDFATCQSTLPSILLNLSGEVKWLSKMLASLSMTLSGSSCIRDLATSYDYPTWKGTFASYYKVMTLLPAGLLLGQAIVKAKRPATQIAARTSAIASTSTHGYTRRSARLSSQRAENPFEKKELLSRLGGRGIRTIALRSKTTAAAPTFDDKEMEKLVSDVKWVAVYRYPLAPLAVLVARAKLVQTVASIIYLPYSFYNYTQGLIDATWLMNTTLLALFAPLALMIFSRTMNRLVGVVAVDEGNQWCRIGYVSFWGRRKNKIRPLDDVIPLAESGADTTHKLVKLSFHSDSSYLLLPTRNVEIVDLERARFVFGNLSFFAGMKDSTK